MGCHFNTGQAIPQNGEDCWLTAELHVGFWPPQTVACSPSLECPSPSLWRMQSGKKSRLSADYQLKLQYLENTDWLPVSDSKLAVEDVEGIGNQGCQLISSLNEQYNTCLTVWLTASEWQQTQITTCEKRISLYRCIVHTLLYVRMSWSDNINWRGSQTTDVQGLCYWW